MKLSPIIFLLQSASQKCFSLAILLKLYLFLKKVGEYLSFSSAIHDENSRRHLFFLFASSTPKLAVEIWEKGKLARETFPGGGRLKTLDECKFSASRKEYEGRLYHLFSKILGREDIETPTFFLAARFRLH